MNAETYATWRRLVAGLLGGLAHDLNGRITALEGLLRLATADGSVESELADRARHEIERLTALAASLNDLPVTPDGTREVLRLGDALQIAAGLARKDARLSRPDFELPHGGGAAVSGVPERVVELLLVALVAARPSRGEGSSVSWGAQPGEVVISVPQTPPDAQSLALADTLAAELDAEVLNEGDRIVLRFTTVA